MKEMNYLLTKLFHFKVVKKNNTSYKKAVRESDSDSSNSACDSELDDMLDDALNQEEGPTPPKVNKV